MLAAVAWVWVVPAVIVGQIRAQYAGEVSIGGWWLGPDSAGVTGLVLHEGAGADSPVWARVDRVETDLSLGGLIRGRFLPGRVELVDPELAFRVGEDGLPQTQIPLSPHAAAKGSKPSPLPAIAVQGAHLRIVQAGRPELAIAGIQADLTPGADGGARLSASTDDPYWGAWDASGVLAPGSPMAGSS